MYTQRLRKWYLKLIILVMFTLVGYSASGSAQPVKANVVEPTTESIATFLKEFIEVRDRAETPGQPENISQFFHPASVKLRQHAIDRTGVIANLGDVFGGDIVRYRSGMVLQNATITGKTAKVRAYEAMEIVWIPTQNDATIPAHSGGKFQEGLVVQRGPNGEITTQAGMVHDMELVFADGQWRITKDGYWGAPDFIPSPDYVKVAVSDTPVSRDSQVGVMASGTYRYWDAANYANKWTNPITQLENNESAYNPAYKNFNPDGGDCANLVSQALNSAGWIQEGSWWYNTNNSAGTGDDTAGYSWVNNWGLRNFALNSYRGTPKTSVTQIGIGDLVNYDWESDGVYDHVTIMVEGASSSLPQGLCTGHNLDVKNYPCLYGRTATHTFTDLYYTYPDYGDNTLDVSNPANR